MKKIVLLLVLVLSFTMTSGLLVFAQNNDFTIYMSDLELVSEKTNCHITAIGKITPKNSAEELSFATIASPNGDAVEGQYYTEGATNRFATYRFTVPASGTYDVDVSFLADWNLGTFQIVIDDTPVGLSIKTSNSAQNVETWMLVSNDVGKVSLTEGAHTLTVVITGIEAQADWTTVQLHSFDFKYIDSYKDNTVIKYELEDQTLVFAKDPVGGGVFSHDSFAGKVYQTDIKTNQQYSFDINLSDSGTYQFNIGYLADWNCAPLAISIDGHKIGTANCFKLAGTGWALASRGVAEVHLEAGTHTVTIAYDSAEAAKNKLVSANDLCNSYVDFISLQVISIDAPSNPNTGDFSIVALSLVVFIGTTVVLKRKRNAA